MGYGTVITVGDANEKLDLGFDCIEVWASTDQGATYEEITSQEAAPASLHSLPAGTTYLLGGRKLRFSIDGGPDSLVEFDSRHIYWTPLEVVAAVNAVHAGVASVASNRVVLTSLETGRMSSVEVTYDDGMLFPVRHVCGKDSRIALVRDRFVYPFTDLAGLPDIRYKWRFSHDGANPVSLFSARVMGTLDVLGGAPVSIAVARFVGVDGKPLKRTVVVSMSNSPENIGGIAVGSSPIIHEADETGLVQMALVKGTTVRVAIEGTAFIREFVVPQTDSFNLLTAMAAAPDPYTVQTTAPLLTRRSL
jgi:hypothetical protein